MILAAKKIVSLGPEAGYLQAWKRAAEKGMKLASNVLHDDYLVRTDRYTEIRRAYPAWAREIVAHPKKGGEFEIDEDVVDDSYGWILPVKYLSDPGFIDGDAFRKGIGLFIDPEGFDTNRKGNVVVIPRSIVLLYPFMQEYRWEGKVDEATRLPLNLPAGNEQDKRRLNTTIKACVMPLARGWGGGSRHVISGCCQPDGCLGVAVEAPSGDAGTQG
jgi:hypothetical protein